MLFSFFLRLRVRDQIASINLMFIYKMGQDKINISE